MLTNPILSVEFEHDDPKYYRLSKNCVAMTAGEALIPTELCENVASEVEAKASPTISDIVQVFCRRYRECKTKQLEEKYFLPRGFTMRNYIELQAHLNENVVLRLERAIESEEMNMTAIIVGVDNNGANLFQIRDPGHADCFKRLGFHAIGSGLPHAISTFISFSFTPNTDLKKATYITYEAKKNAEKAPGVGKTATDIGIISCNEIRVIKPEEIKILEEIYQKKMELGKKGIADVESMISGLPF